jgi:hypothetical protein
MWLTRQRWSRKKKTIGIAKVAKLKHTAAASKPCVNLVTVSKRYAYARARPNLPHTVCLPAYIAIRDITRGKQIFFVTVDIKRPDRSVLVEAHARTSPNTKQQVR